MRSRSTSFAHGQSGFALIAALFLIVVLAALGAFAVRINNAHQSATELELLSARARFAAQAAIEYAARRLETSNDCNAVTASPPALANGMNVTIACQPLTTHVVNGLTRTVYSIDVRATSGVYGSPDFVARRVRARVLI